MWNSGEDAPAPKAQDEFPPWINNKEYLPNAGSPTNTLTGGSSLSSDHSNHVMPSVIGFFNNRRDSQVSSSVSGSRRNSELEIQHQACLNEGDMENRRQKKSLRQFQRKNTMNSSTEETILENDAAAAGGELYGISSAIDALEQTGATSLSSNNNTRL